MISIWKREMRKLFKMSVLLPITILLILFSIYSYISIGLDFQENIQSFLVNSSYNQQQVYDYIENSDLKVLLAAQLFVIDPSVVITYSLSVFNSLGPMAFAIIGALFFGMEYRYGTIRQLWVSGINKFYIMMGKVLSLVVLIIVSILIMIMLGYMMSFITIRVFDMPTDLVNHLKPHFSFQLTLLQIVGTLFSLLLWALFGGFCAVLTQNIIIGITIGIIYPMIESIFTYSLPIGPYFPLFVQKSMLPILFEQTAFGGLVSFDMGANLYSLSESLWLTLGYILVFAALIHISFKTQRLKI